MGENNAINFWSWSIERYRQNGVDSLSLQLQDEHSLNVNLLLWTCWCAEHFETAPQSAINAAIEVANEWNRPITTPLRKVRRVLKTKTTIKRAKDLRTQIKAAELGAEQIEQELLEELAKSALTPIRLEQSPKTIERAMQNITSYVNFIVSQTVDPSLTSLLHEFVERIFAESDPTRAAKGPSQ